MAVSPCVEVLAYGEPHHEQGDQLGDDHGGEDLNAHGLPETSLVDQHLGDYSEAGQGQHPGQSQGLGKVEAQPQVVEDVGGNRQGRQQRYDHGQHRGEEETASNGGEEPPDVQLLQAYEEEEHEDADAQDHLDLGARLHQPRCGAEDDAGGGVGDDRVEAESSEYAFGQLGDDNEEANRKKRFVDFQSEASSLAVPTLGRCWRKAKG